MKRRLVQALLLSAMMVSLSASSVVPVKGHEKIIKTDVAAQARTTNVDTSLFGGASKSFYEVLEQSLYTSTTKYNKENLFVLRSANEYAAINEDVNAAISKMEKEMQTIKQVTDKKEYILLYKEIVNKYSYILDPPETIYDYFSSNELDMLFGVVQAEIGDEYSFEQKCNVVSVILNRIDHYKFPDEMIEILTASQFETIGNGRYRVVEVSEDTILACEYVFLFGDTTNGALFFDSNNTLNYSFLFNDGAHNFYGLRMG